MRTDTHASGLMALTEMRLADLWHRFVGGHPRLTHYLVLAILVLSSLGVARLMSLHEYYLGGWITVGALAFSLMLFARRNVHTFPMISAALSLTVSVSALAYIFWRTGTFNMNIWPIAFALFLAEAFGTLHLLGFYYTMQPRDEPTLDLTDDPSRFPVFIFIPTVNEGPAILEPTIHGALAAKARYLEQYPQAQVTIVICNDGYVAGVPNWQEAEALADRMGVECVTRRVKGGAKAGNIENARQEFDATGDALVVIFDADQIAAPDFLVKTVAPFADPSIGWVQTGQYYRNLENPVARWSNDQQSMFYKLLCPGKSTLNAMIICGTNVVIRARALDQIGGLPQDNITEDMAASICLHGEWRSIYLQDELVTGLGPMDLPSYFKQQRRWATGNLAVLRDHWRDIFLPWHGKLSLPQRIQYALACTHYLCGVRDLIYLLAPISFLLLGITAIDATSMDEFLRNAVPYWLMSQVAFWIVIRGRTGLRGMLLTFISFPIFISSLLTVITGKRLGFQVTAKNRVAGQMPVEIKPHVGLFILYVVSLGVAVYRIANHVGLLEAVLMSLFWLLYQLFYLSGAFWLVMADSMHGREIRLLRPFRTVLAARPVQNAGWRLRRVAPSLGVAGFAMSFVLLSLPLLTRVLPGATPASAATTLSATSTPYVITAQAGSGIPNAPTGLLADLLTEETQLINRAFTIHDKLDRGWLDAVSTRKVLPWITLRFVEPEGGDPTIVGEVESPVDETLTRASSAGNQALGYSLLAIANGVRDGELRRWARDIRAYGKTVFLAPMADVDRSWGAPSVARRGVLPKDVPLAWAHIREIFSEEGVTNVVWVWSVADPMNDRIYMPPADQVDVKVLPVMVDDADAMAELDTMLNLLRQRHPTLSFILAPAVHHSR